MKLYAVSLALISSPASGDAYDVLLSNPRVTSSIESNPFIEPGAYEDFLRLKIDQLENNDTESWNDYRHPPPHTPGPWPQRLSVALA